LANLISKCLVMLNKYHFLNVAIFYGQFKVLILNIGKSDINLAHFEVFKVILEGKILQINI